MMKRKILLEPHHPVLRVVLVLLIACMLGSCCPRLDPCPSFLSVREQVECRSGETIRWNCCAEERCQRIRDLLSRPLELEDVVELTLLNNRRLQATYEQLGIAQADLVQACLLKNPVLAFQLRYDQFFRGEKVIETGIMQNFLDILLKPLQIKMAREELEKVKSMVAGEVIAAIAEAKRMFFSLQAAKRSFELQQELLLIAESSYEAADRLREAGNIKKLELSIYGSLLARARVDEAQAEIDVINAREGLNSLMGLWEGATAWDLTEVFYPVPRQTQKRKNIEDLVLINSLDLNAARHEIRQTAARIGIEVTETVIPEFGIGVDAEREPDGNWFAGPQFTIGIPVFDFGQAKSAAGRAELRQLCDNYYATAVELRAAARAASFRLWNNQRQYSSYEETLLPLMEEVTEETLLQLNAMQVGVFELLDAKQREVEARVKMVDTYRGYWEARIELERLIQGRKKHLTWME